MLLKMLDFFIDDYRKDVYIMNTPADNIFNFTLLIRPVGGLPDWVFFYS